MEKNARGILRVSHRRLSSQGNKPSVCFLSFSAYPLFRPGYGVPHGGAELEMYSLSTTLAARGYSVDVLTGDFGQPEMESIHGVRVWRGPTLSSSSLLRGLVRTYSLFRWMRRINADVYCAKGAGFLPFQIALYCAMFRKRFIFKSSHTRNIDGSLRSRTYHPFYAWSLRRADAVVVQNEDDVPVVRTVYHVHATVTKNYHAMPPSADILPLRLREGIIWVGRVAAIKRLDILLEVARAMPAFPFRIVGMTARNDGGWDALKESAKDLENVSFESNVPHHAIDPYFQHATLLVTTSEGEGFPNVFIEALKWGTPLASLFVNPDQCITKEQIGVFGNGNVEKLERGIQDLLSDPVRWKLYSENARRYAEREFSENNITKFESILSTITETK